MRRAYAFMTEYGKPVSGCVGNIGFYLCKYIVEECVLLAYNRIEERVEALRVTNS